MLNCFMDLLVRNQMKRTIEHLKAQDVETPEEIREEIKIFRDKRLSEEQEEQNNVMMLICDIYVYTYVIFVLIYILLSFAGFGITKQITANELERP